MEIRSDSGRRLAYSQVLAKTADRRMALLTRQENRVARLDRWPTRRDIGRLVLLPGGEVGVLVQWWNADDGSEWRWQVEFHNHR